jgi:hypothetical protein
VPTNKQKIRLDSAAADLYLLTSTVALSSGAISWEQHLLRLQLVRDHAVPDSVPAKVASEVLDCGGDVVEDEWPIGERAGLESVNGPSDSEVTFTDEDGLGFLHLRVAGNTGLSKWAFHQADADPFPSIPHGHFQSEKLDAYRGWIYRRDKQIGREPRCKIIALWNDQKFRAFASVAIGYYQSHFPYYRWGIPDPMRLPRER